MDGELVATVSEHPVHGADVGGQGVGQLAEEAVAGGVPQAVVEALEAVEVEHEQGERAGATIGVARQQLLEVGLEGAVVAQAGQGVALGSQFRRVERLGRLEGGRCLAGEELGELELVRREVGLGLAHPSHVQGADHLPADAKRDDDERLGLDGRPRDVHGARVQVSVVGEERPTVVDRPAGQAGVGGDLPARITSA